MNPTKWLFTLLLLSLGAAHAQTSVTIPAQTVTTPVTINGTTIQISITIPSQAITIPAQGGSTLPSGLTYTPASGSTPGLLTVSGNVSASAITLTGGPTLPTCTSALYLWQLVSGTLEPVCYVAPTFPTPSIAVSQATGTNAITLTPSL